MKIFFWFDAVSVRVSVRVDYTWVYEVVVTDSIRRKYNLNLNLTSDVSSILFEKIRSESSYFQLKASNPKGKAAYQLPAFRTLSVRKVWRSNSGTFKSTQCRQ